MRHGVNAEDQSEEWGECHAKADDHLVQLPAVVEGELHMLTKFGVASGQPADLAFTGCG